jgi:phosphodiesterase/alkaline phosphatase D-like protein
MNINITTKILKPNNNAFKIQASTASDFSSIAFTSTAQVPDIYNLIKFSITNLNSNTKYYIRIVNINNVPIDEYVGSFKTPGTEAQSFKFGFASCSWSDESNASNSQIYTNIANKAINNELDFFIHLGDMHYRDISINNEANFQKAFDDVFNSPNQNNCWKNIPMYYMWDDHDYGPNDSDKNSPSRLAAIAAYRRRVPSPPLAKTGVTDAPYYSFSRGRVRFVVTDIRSERESKGAYPSTNSAQQVFSADQKNWFFGQLLSARLSNQIIVWINTKPWVSSIEDGKDDWGGYHAARIEIVTFINNNSLADKIVIISGDMHALAYDDGSSVNNYGSLKVCHAAALDQEGRAKGGPYTIGPIIEDSGTGWVTQYGIIEVTDTGGATINIRFKGIIINKINFSESVGIDVNFNLTPESSGSAPAAPNQPTITNITDQGFEVNWNVVSGATSYRVDISTEEDFSSYISGYQNKTVATNSEIVTGLTPETTYYVRVRAVNISGTSSNSVSQNATTLASISCTAVPPESVDVNSLCYIQTITNDSYCCENDWDSVCQEAYDNCLEN